MRFRFSADLIFAADDVPDAEKKLRAFLVGVLDGAKGTPADEPLAEPAGLTALEAEPDGRVLLDCLDDAGVQAAVRARYAPLDVAEASRRMRVRAEYEAVFGKPAAAPKKEG